MPTPRSTAGRELPELAPPPTSGRVFVGPGRPVRVADVHPSGRLRLDGVARYLQDVSSDDTLDAALPKRDAWVVRRTVVQVDAFPRHHERLAMRTWCSGVGSHYAERRIELRGGHGGSVDATSLWVAVDPRSGRPTRVSEEFRGCYGEAAGGRKVSARLAHPTVPDDLELLDWSLRATDFDPWRHVNNSVCWAILEEAVGAAEVELAAPLVAEVEHPTAIGPGAAVRWGWRADGGGFLVWVLADGAVAATGRVRLLG